MRGIILLCTSTSKSPEDVEYEPLRLNEFRLNMTWTYLVMLM